MEAKGSQCVKERMVQHICIEVTRLLTLGGVDVLDSPEGTGCGARVEITENAEA